MQHYELFYIIPSKFTDSEITGLMKKVEAVVVKHGGVIRRHEDGGKLKFSYPIKRVRFGNYILMELEAEPSVPKLVEQELRLSLNAEVLRFLLTKQNESLRGRPLKLSAYIVPLTEDEPEADQRTPRAPIPTTTLPISSEDLEKKIDAALVDDTAKL